MKDDYKFNTKPLVPSQWYHNKLMQEIDDAEWLGDDDDSWQVLRATAQHIKEEYIDKGKTWYPKF